MKIILTQDVENLGHSMDVVEVADGYARNFLMPRQLAMPATKSALANLEHLRAIEERKQQKLKAAAQEQASRLEGQTLTFDDANVGAEGRLYGSIGALNIATAISRQFGLDIDRRLVILSDPIREEGFYTIPVKLHREVVVQLRTRVGHPKEPVAAEPQTAEPVAEAAAA